MDIFLQLPLTPLSSFYRTIHICLPPQACVKFIYFSKEGKCGQNGVLSVGVSVWFASHWVAVQLRGGEGPPLAGATESPHVPDTRPVANPSPTPTMGIASASRTQHNLN